MYMSIVKPEVEFNAQLTQPDRTRRDALISRVASATKLDSFYHVMLCIRATSHGPVSVSVCLSQVGVLLKRQNVGSHKQHHTIPQGL